MEIFISEGEQRLIELCSIYYDEQLEYISFFHTRNEQIISDYINQFLSSQKIAILSFLNNIFLKEAGINKEYNYDNNPLFTFSDCNYKSDSEMKTIINAHIIDLEKKIIDFEINNQYSRNPIDRITVKKIIDSQTAILAFLSKLSLLQKLIARDDKDITYCEIFESLYSEINNEIEFKITGTHSVILGGVGFSKELEDQIIIRRVTEFYFNNGWINEEEILPFPTYIFIILYRHANKKLFIPEKMKKLWDITFEEMRIEQFENKLRHVNTNKIDTSQLNSISGEEFELLLDSLFKQMGYYVILTSASQDYGADLIIEKGSDRTVIQAKSYSNQNVGIAAIQEIVAAKKYYQATNALVITNSSFTINAINLAEKNGVELWDGKKLIEIINSLNR